jgi:hypothetical protein
LLPLLDWWIVNQEIIRISHTYIVPSTRIVNHLYVVCSVGHTRPTRRWPDFLFSRSQVGEHIARLTCLPLRQMCFNVHYGRHCYHGLAMHSPSLVSSSDFAPSRHDWPALRHRRLHFMWDWRCYPWWVNCGPTHVVCSLDLHHPESCYQSRRRLVESEALVRAFSPGSNLEPVLKSFYE